MFESKLDVVCSSTEDDKELYLRGSCHVLAIALHRRYRMSIVVAIDTDEIYWADPEDLDYTVPNVVHCYAVDLNGMAWDVLGARDARAMRKELVDRYYDVGMLERDEVRDEAGIGMYIDGRSGSDDDRPLHSYTEDDIAQADEFISRAMAHFIEAAPNSSPIKQTP